MLTIEEKRQRDLQNLPFSARTDEQRFNKKGYKYRQTEPPSETYYMPRPFQLGDSDIHDIDAILRFKTMAAPSIEKSVHCCDPTISDLVKEKDRIMVGKPILSKRIMERLNSKSTSCGPSSPRKANSSVNYGHLRK